MAWLTGWDKRIKITVDSGVVDSDLTHFPVCVRLGISVGKTSADVSAVFDEVGANSKKIAITKTDGETEIYCEIEQWDSGNELAVLWVSKSDLVITSAGDYDLYLYYDNDHADNDTYIADVGSRTEVWNANYKAVYHLNDDDTDTTVIDSVGNYNGTKKANAEPTQADAKIGKGQNFDGTDDYINVSSALSIANLTAYTIEAFTKIPQENSRYIYGEGSNKSNTPMLFLVTTGNSTWKIWHTHRDDDGTELDGAGSVTVADNTWHYVSMVRNGDDWLGYVDETASYSKTVANVGVTTMNEIYIGAMKRNTFLGYGKGIIDELRISTTNRSASWLKASYNSGNDSLLTYGEEEAPSTKRRIIIIN